MLSPPYPEMSGRPAAVDHVDLAGRIGGGGQMQRECRDLFRLADPAYGLARNEGGAGAFIIAPGAQALLKLSLIHI